jgi:hypothetical protein
VYIYWTADAMFLTVLHPCRGLSFGSLPRLLLLICEGMTFVPHDVTGFHIHGDLGAQHKGMQGEVGAVFCLSPRRVVSRIVVLRSVHFSP